MHGLGDIVGADDRRPSQNCEDVGSDRSAQPLIGWRWRNLVDEALAGSANEEREPERFEFPDACDRGEALLRCLAEADAGIEHDLLPCDPGAPGDLERAGKERRDIRQDVYRGIGGVAIVHDDDRYPAFGDDLGQRALALQAPHVVDDCGAGCECPFRDRGLHGVDGDRNTQCHCGRQDRGKAPYFLVARHRHGTAVRAGRFGTDVQNVGSFRDHPARLLEGRSWIEKAPAVGEGVGGDVEHAHHEWTAKRKQPCQPIRRFFLLADGTPDWAYQRHTCRFAPDPRAVSSARTISQFNDR